MIATGGMQRILGALYYEDETCFAARWLTRPEWRNIALFARIPVICSISHLRPPSLFRGRWEGGSEGGGRACETIATFGNLRSKGWLRCSQGTVTFFSRPACEICPRPRRPCGRRRGGGRNETPLRRGCRSCNVALCSITTLRIEDYIQLLLLCMCRKREP